VAARRCMTARSYRRRLAATHLRRSHASAACRRGCVGALKKVYSLDGEETSGADDPALTVMLLAVVGAGAAGEDLVATLSGRRYCNVWGCGICGRSRSHRPLAGCALWTPSYDTNRTFHVAQETTRTNVPVALLDRRAPVQGLQIS
jgi:hypothetical protein